MEEIIKILMDRDGMTREDALDLLQDTKDEIQEVFLRDEYASDEIEDIFMDNIGLEPDYIPTVMMYDFD